MNENIKQRLTMTDRQTVELFGVLRVETFDSSEIVLATSMGEMVLSGSELHISRLHLDEKEASIKGQVDSIIYRKSKNEKRPALRSRSVIERIFK
ncbi:MAG: YabP/YqfC family sporulation protein [Clostridiales bacterium]|nr:YabP/YqfC family sporulation protein [Clostridiales bacterium]